MKAYLIYFITFNSLFYKLLNFRVKILFNIIIIAIITTIIIIYFPDSDTHSVNLVENLKNISNNENYYHKINYYNNFYGIFNFDSKIHIPSYFINQNISDYNNKESIMVTQPEKIFPEIIRLADYRFMSLKYDIYQIVNNMLEDLQKINNK